MTIKDYLYLAITICFYAVTYIAYAYTKSKVKINKATKLGQVEDLIGKKATWAVHVAEDADLESNDDKHQFAKDLIVQGLHTMGITSFTSQELDGAIKVATQAMHLAWDANDTEPDTSNEVKADVPAQDVVKPAPVAESTQAGDQNA